MDVAKWNYLTSAFYILLLTLMMMVCDSRDLLPWHAGGHLLLNVAMLSISQAVIHDRMRIHASLPYVLFIWSIVTLMNVILMSFYVTNDMTGGVVMTVFIFLQLVMYIMCMTDFF